MKVLVLNNFAIGQTHLGKSVFAARPFKKGGVITQFTGDLVTKKDLPEEYQGEHDRFVQIGPDKFLGPSGEVDDFINHSCEPNAGLKFSDTDILLVAINNIAVGEEITWDYSTTMFENNWKMRCECRKSNCRKIIGDFTLLDSSLQQYYKKLEIIPPYIVDFMNSPEYEVYTKGMDRLKQV